MGKVIKIRDAQIRTVKIEIKSMTIDDRQVTLALFRQLVEEDLISGATGVFGSELQLKLVEKYGLTFSPEVVKLSISSRQLS